MLSFIDIDRVAKGLDIAGDRVFDEIELRFAPMAVPIRIDDRILKQFGRLASLEGRKKGAPSEPLGRDFLNFGIGDHAYKSVQEAIGGPFFLGFGNKGHDVTALAGFVFREIDMEGRQRRRMALFKLAPGEKITLPLFGVARDIHANAIGDARDAIAVFHNRENDVLVAGCDVLFPLHPEILVDLLLFALGDPLEKIEDANLIVLKAIAKQGFWHVRQGFGQTDFPHARRDIGDLLFFDVVFPNDKASAFNG